MKMLKILLALSMTALIGLGQIQAGEGAKRRETRPTLSPGLFVGRVAQAYQVAKDIPEVLDQLYCYCYCDRDHGHKTLLTCYTETHAAT